MQIRIKLTFLFVIAFVFSLEAQDERSYINYKRQNNNIEIITNDGKYLIIPYAEKIIETSFIPIGEEYNPNSHAVVLKPKNINVNIVETENTLELNTEGIKVLITKLSFNISYYYKNKRLISEKAGYLKTKKFETLSFAIDENEKLFGGGARVLGMNRRGYRLQLYNRAHYGYTTHSELMNFTMPVVVSSKMYTIHFDNAPIGYLDLDSKKTNTLTYETISGRKTYQIIAGDSWEDLIDQYTDLTGKQPMPPRWAFGNFSSRFGYHSENEVYETVNEFIEDSIPLDAVIIDIYWFGKDIKGHMGNLEFLKDSFPTPQRMINDFKDKGIKTILVTEPFILTTSKRWNEAVEKQLLATDKDGNPFTYDFYFGNTGLLDIYKPEVKDWFWNIYKTYTNMGIGGWWGDLGEPEVHPLEAQHYVGSADEVHNIYGHDWTKLIYEGYQKDFPEQRPFILMRAGYSGSQHYGILPWTGDVSRSWSGLKPQVEISLQMGLQGIAYMHSDLGGFAGGEVFDSKLYTRWLQYGVFQPIYRPHAQEHIASEPVFHDEHTKSLARESIQLRYRLLPYNYTLAFDNNQTGIPLMRPLFFIEPENNNLLEVSDIYLWGDNFLVSPITDTTLKQKEIYMPAHANWFDFYTDKAYKGGTTYQITIHEDHIPVFVKAGSFIPMVQPVQSTELYNIKKMEIHYYPDPTIKENTGKLYDDDGITPNAFEKGLYEILTFKGNIINEGLNIKLSSNLGNNYKALDREINLIIHQFGVQPQEVLINGNPELFDWNKDKDLINISFLWEAEKDYQIVIKPQEMKIKR